MTINRRQARPLMTAAEYEFFETSFGDALKALTPARIAGKVRRARTLRDKYTDLLRRQKIATRGRTGSKSGANGDANARTERKAQAFGEALERFEARGSQLEAAQAREAKRKSTADAKAMLEKKKAAQKKQAANRSAATGGKVSAKRTRAGASKASPAKQAAPRKIKELQMQGTRGRAVLGHVSTKVRQAQARRDSRG